MKTSLISFVRAALSGAKPARSSGSLRLGKRRHRRAGPRIEVESLEARLCMSAVPAFGHDDGVPPLPPVVSPVSSVRSISVAAPHVASVVAPAAYQPIKITTRDVVAKGTDAVFTVALRSAPGDKTVTVAYTTVDRGAKAGVNYTKTSGVLTFTGDEVSKTISVPVLETSPDQQKSPTFSVVISQAKDQQGRLIPINGKLVNTSATTRIITPPPASAPGSQFQIFVNFPDSTLTTQQQLVFQQAAYRWSEIIVGDLSPVAGQVADVVIDATGPAIDGVNGILGQAGPTAFRPDSTGLPYRGQMMFDSADLASMTSNGTLYNVILHEMGHVLGFGTLWANDRLITGVGTATPLFVGTNALREYRTLSGKPTATGVPVESGGGAGTANAHWSESVFNSELMTGYAEAAGVNMPISRVTVGSLEDLGYTVNYAKADNYVLGSLRADIAAAAPAVVSSSAASKALTWLVSSQESLPTLNAAATVTPTTGLHAVTLPAPKSRPRPVA